MKWNSEQIIAFLNVYEKYDILWDIRNNNHMNKLKRDTAFDELLKEVKEINGLETTDLVILKIKLKTIKTVYRQEVNKILKSKKSGSGTDDLYTPKLVWFAKADNFLKNITISRDTTNNMTEEIRQENSESNHIGNEGVDDPESAAVESGTTNVVNELFQTPKRKRSGKVVPNSGIDKAIDNLKKIVEKNETKNEDEYDAFAKHIATQLRQLPTRSSIILQEQIQQLITRERLIQISPSIPNVQNNDRTFITVQSPQYMINQNPQYQQENVDTLQLIDSRPSTSSSSYSQYSDIVQQAMSDIDYNDI